MERERMATQKEQLDALRRRNAPEIARLCKIMVDAAEAAAALELRMEAEARAIGFANKQEVGFQPNAMLYEQMEWYNEVQSLRFSEVANFMDRTRRAALAFIQQQKT